MKLLGGDLCLAEGRRYAGGLVDVDARLDAERALAVGFAHPVDVAGRIAIRALEVG